MNSLGLFVFLSTLLLAFAQEPVCRYDLQFSSNNFKYTRTTVPGAIHVNSVELTQQQSNSPCILNQSYGNLGPDVWVSNGCRGVFKVCYEPGRNIVILCSSNDFKPARCFVGYNIKYLTVNRQISGSPCILDATYSFSGAYITVNSGCRAYFTAGVKE